MLSLLFVYMIGPDVPVWCGYFPQHHVGKPVIFRRDVCVCACSCLCVSEVVGGGGFKALQRR
jgi:hypothetical protein